MHKNADNASPKENVDNSKDNSRYINSKSKKSIAILGDSMLRHLNGQEMLKKLRATARFFSSIFQGQQQITWKIT